MEDYDVFNEMQNVQDKKTIIIVEDDENFITQNLLDSSYEIIPIRFNYDLSCFSSSYIDRTKELFIYYYSENNNYHIIKRRIVFLSSFLILDQNIF